MRNLPKGNQQPHDRNMRKVLVDENLSIPKDEHRLRLLNKGVALVTVADVDLKSTANGELQSAAYDMGFGALMTFDKMMADETRPRLPVLVFDEVSMEKIDDTFNVLVDVLVSGELGEPDYYPVLVAGVEPTSKLRELAAGIYRQNPRANLTGRGYLKARWDDRDSSAPVSGQLTDKKRRAMRGVRHICSRQPTRG